MQRSKSRGSVAFEQAPGSTADKASRIAAREGKPCSKDAVSSYFRGDRQPSEERQHVIEELFGVPWLWWRERLSPTAAPPPAAAPPGAPEAATPQAVAERADWLMADVDAAREAASHTADPAERIRLLEKAASITGTLAKLRGSLQSERQVVENPHMRRICERVMRALESYPEAAKAVRDAMAPEDTES